MSWLPESTKMASLLWLQSAVFLLFLYFVMGFALRRTESEEGQAYCSPNIVGVIKSRRMRWAGHVACMEEGRGVHKVLVGKPEGKRPLGDQDVDGRIILRRIFRKWEGVVGTGWSWLRTGTGGGRL